MIPAFISLLKLSYLLFNNRWVPCVEDRAVAQPKQSSKANSEAGTPGFILAGMAIKCVALQVNRLPRSVSRIFDTYCEHLKQSIIGTGENFDEPGSTVRRNL